MQVLNEGIRVNFTSIENQALRNGLEVVTRLVSNISGDADKTSDIGTNATSARDAINYLLNQGGSDNSLEIMSPYEGLIVTQEQMATLEAAKEILRGLMSPSTDDPSHDWWYLGLDLELPVTVDDTTVTYEPDSLRIYKDRLAATNPYRLDFTFTGTDSKLYKVKQGLVYTEMTIEGSTVTIGTWSTSGSASYEVYNNSTWTTTSSSVASSKWPVISPNEPASLANAPTQYVAVINQAGFNPNAAYNWISERTNITDAAQELYDLYINVLNNYTVSDVEQFPTYALGTWTWTNMPFDNIPVVFNNGSHTFTYYFTFSQNNPNNGVLTNVNLPKETIEGSELQYNVSLGSGTVLNDDQVVYTRGNVTDAVLSSLIVNSENGDQSVTLNSIAYVKVTLRVTGSYAGTLIYTNEETGVTLEVTKGTTAATIEKVVPVEALSYTLTNFNGIYPVGNTTIAFTQTGTIQNVPYSLSIAASQTTTGNEATLTVTLDDELLSGSYVIRNTEYWITPSNLSRSVEISRTPIKVGNQLVNGDDVAVEAGPGFIFKIGADTVNKIEIETNTNAILTTATDTSEESTDSDNQNFS